MSAVLGVLRFIGVKGAALIGLGGYLYSKSEDGAFAKTVDEKLLPVIGDIGQKIADGATKTVTGLAENVGAQGAIKGAAETSNSVLGKLPGVVSGAAEYAPAVGNALYNGTSAVVGGTAAGVSKAHDGILGIISEHFPNIPGWMKATAAVGTLAAGGGFLAHKWGGIPGKIADSIAGVPGGLLSSALGGVGSVVTWVAGGVALLAAGYFLLHPSGQEKVGGLFAGIKNFFNKDKSPAPEHGHAPEQAVVAAQPTNEVASPRRDVASVDVRDVNLARVSGGENADFVALNLDRTQQGRTSGAATIGRPA